MQIYFQTTFNIELLTKKGHNSYGTWNFTNYRNTYPNRGITLLELEVRREGISNVDSNF
jgi:hypothetical protein